MQGARARAARTASTLSKVSVECTRASGAWTAEGRGNGSAKRC